MAIPRRNRRGVGQAISALKAGGLPEKSDESVCALARASAEVLDDALAFGDVKACALSNLMRTHLMICEALRSRRGPDDGDSAYAVPVVDKTGFVKRSPKVAGLRPQSPPPEPRSRRGRAAVNPPGSRLVRSAPSAKCRPTARGRDTEPGLRGRAVVTPEAVAFYTHRREVVAPACRDAHIAAGEALGTRPALVRAAKGTLPSYVSVRTSSPGAASS